MSTVISNTALNQITSHHRRLGLKFCMKGMAYERCAELSWVVEYLRPRFDEELDYLDIGTGESPLPSFLLAHTRWNIACLDKCRWVQRQKQFFDRVGHDHNNSRRSISVKEVDLATSDLPDESCDVITCISVIEHFEGNSDSMAMQKIASLLRPQGILILTTLMNDGFFAEFFVKKEVYGTAYSEAPVFYQRHYDVKNISQRLIQPSGLAEQQRVYFGDYGFQCFEKVMQQPKPLKALYAWSTPFFARRFLSFQSRPVTRKEMRMNTASGIILVLQKRP